MTHRIVAIHQPNFIPWLGYFDKINKSDIFVLMDHVQLQKTGGVWTNRVKIAVQNKPHWITVPLIRNYHGFLLIKDIQINDTMDWRTRILKTIEFNYCKCPFFGESWELICKLIQYKTKSLSDFNRHSIGALMAYLDLDTSKLITGSSLKTEGKATELLISMTKALGGTVYLCGGGTESYQEDSKFGKAGIHLNYQNFQHPVYPQKNTGAFIAGLSIIDTLMNCGKEGTKELLHIGGAGREKEMLGSVH